MAISYGHHCQQRLHSLALPIPGSNTTSATFLQFCNHNFFKIFSLSTTITVISYSSRYFHLFSENRYRKTSNISTSFSRPCVYSCLCIAIASNAHGRPSVRVTSDRYTHGRPCVYHQSLWSCLKATWPCTASVSSLF